MLTYIPLCLRVTPRVRGVPRSFIEGFASGGLIEPVIKKSGFVFPKIILYDKVL